MVGLTQGNLLKADAEALVNTVNCVGHMGKGIALQFKKAFPDNYVFYKKACDLKKVRIGDVLVYETGTLVNPKYIINFPTKNHWHGKSKYEFIDSGLKALLREVEQLSIKSIAIPPLGTGLGGLEWKRVRLMIEETFANLGDVNTILYEPAGAPPAADMLIGTKKPKMTISRALLLKLIQQYSQHFYRHTLLEIQKLAYFLQESGENLRLRYVKHRYGPYAHNLNKVLEILEGHYIEGYGDTQKPDVEIELLEGAIENADNFLATHSEPKRRLNRVAELVDGFETPYGMELLSSIHWLIAHDGVAKESGDVVQGIQKWSDRKARLFQESHIEIALERLKLTNWI